MTQETNPTPYFLQGGGEMGEMIRKFDWSKTPLGPVDQWPQSLCTTVGIMLDNPFGMYIAWGEEYIQLYNDGYRPILGTTKHPKALGIGTRDTFAEIWHIIGPMFEGVMQGTAVGFPGFMLPLDRNGYVEECFFDFSYSPIRKENGEVGGVLVTVIETTEEVKRLQQIKEIGEQYQFAIDAAELGTWDLDPTTNIFTGNERLKEWFGVNPAEEVELKHALAAIADRDLNRVIEAMQKALQYTFGGLYDIEYTIVHPRTRAERIVRARGRAYFNEDKVAYRFNGTLQDITEEIKARQALVQSERNFRNMIRQSPVAMCVLRGKDYVVEIANEKMFELWGRPGTELMNRPIFEGLPEAREQGLEVLLDHVYATGERFMANERLVHLPRKGEISPTYLNFVYEAMREGDGTITGILAVAIDVTDQVEARHQIEFAEERARLAIEASDMGTFDLNLVTNEIITSPRFNAIFGLDHAAAHKDYVSRLHPDDITVRNQAHKKALEDGRLFYEARVVWSDGSIHWVRGEGKVYYDEQKNATRMLGTMLDITAEKKAQEELNLSLEKFRLLADSMPQFIWTGDPEGSLNYFNKAVSEYSGLPIEQLMRDGWIQIVHPEDRDENIRKWQHSVTTGEDLLIEHRFRRHDGTYRWQLSRALPQRDSNGVIQMWVGTSTDIHDKKLFMDELEEKVNERTVDLQEANLRLERSNAELEQFAYVASHDLQEPLRKIKAFGDMLKNRYRDKIGAEGADMIDRMQSASERMRALIEDLLAFSRVSANKNAFEVVDLNELIGEVLGDMETTIREKEATINISRLMKVYADPLQMRQLFQNVISNSLKFVKPDVKPVIDITSEAVTGKSSPFDVSKEDAPKAFQQITLKDNGIGFEPEYSKKIFQIFQRLHGRSEYPGAGMGLSIVQKVVENHHGYISATGRPGEGATIGILLPVVKT